MNYLKNLGTTRTAIIALIVANIIWGASFPIYKLALTNIPPFTFSFLRFFLAALIILPFVIKNLTIAREDYKNLILVSVISITIQIPLIYVGLSLTSSINAPIIIATAPIILMISSVIFLKEKIKAKTIAGTIISLLGILVIMIEPILIVGFTGSAVGNILIFLATICSVIQAILLKKLTVRNEPITLIFWMFFLGSLPLLPFVIWESKSFNFFQDITVNGLIGLIYGIYLSAVLAHFLFAYGVKYIKASEVGIFNYVDPIATIVIAIPLLGEQLTVPYVIGAMLVFLGIYIVEGRLHYHPFQKLFSKN